MFFKKDFNLVFGEKHTGKTGIGALMTMKESKCRLHYILAEEGYSAELTKRIGGSPDLSRASIEICRCILLSDFIMQQWQELSAIPLG